MFLRIYIPGHAVNLGISVQMSHRYPSRTKTVDNVYIKQNSFTATCFTWLYMSTELHFRVEVIELSLFAVAVKSGHMIVNISIALRSTSAYAALFQGAKAFKLIIITKLISFQNP